MFDFQLDKTFYTVHSENRQFEEAIAFINEVIRLHYEGSPSSACTHELKKVQIAGTNGKGSTAAMLAAILKQAGYKVGLYTSPSLVCVNERIRIDDVMISDDDLCKYIPCISQAQENIGRLFGGFERITAASLLYYLDNNVDIAIMETGLGGRYDTVSAVDKLMLASITSIGMDHMVMLGDTLDKIASEKSGIMRKNVPTVIHNQQLIADEVIVSTASELNSQLIRTSDCKIISTNVESDWQQIVISAYGTEYNVRISLAGDYQRENAENALLCALQLQKLGYSITKDDIENGFENAKWEGRLQKTHLPNTKSEVILDGAHNPHAMKAVADYIVKTSPEKKFVVLLSVMADKDIEGVLCNVKRFADRAVCVSVTERSCKPYELEKKAKALGIDAVSCDNVSDGLILADELANGDVFYVLGSLYLVGKVLAMIDR